MPRSLEVLYLFLCCFFSTACVYNRAEPSAGPLPRDVIVVIGEGEVMTKPDVARLQLGVEARAPDAKQAVEAINGKVASMIEVLKGLGIAAEDLQTRDFNIHSERVETEPPGVEELNAGMAVESAPMNRPAAAPKTADASGVTQAEAQPSPRKRRQTSFVYRASNTLHVTVRNLDKLGEVLSQAVDAGANHAWGISFDLDNDGPAIETARAEAVSDARAQASKLAELSGVKLGKVVSISEVSTGGGPMPMAPMMSMKRMESVPTESGQLAVTRQVQVVFAIEHDDAR